MKRHTAAMAAFISLAVSLPAHAGYWNYGCKGNLDDTTIEFDRNALLIMPKELAKGDTASSRARSSPSTPPTTIPVSSRP